MKNTILLADNQEEELTTWKRYIASAGYEVRLAHDPVEAREILQKSNIDLAVIDLRLVDDDDSNDISGILLAKEKAFRHIPKIILTAFSIGYSDIREVLGPVVDELPPTAAFVSKSEGPQALIEVVQRTLQYWPRLRETLTKVSDQIKADHEAARQQAKLNYRLAFILAIAGAVIIFSGVGLAFFNLVTIGLVATAGGIIGEVLSYHSLARVNMANGRMDAYHRELLQTYWFDFLLAATEELTSDKQSVCKEELIRVALHSWLSPASGLIDGSSGRAQLIAEPK